MKKEYDHNPEKSEKNEIREPALKYETSIPSTPPCQYSVEELGERVVMATKHVEEGKYYTDEELDDFVLS